MFRELGYGVCFFAFAIIGATIGGLFSSVNDFRPIASADRLSLGAVAGAIVGGLFWLWAKYNVHSVQGLARGLIILLAGFAGIGAASLVQPAMGEDEMPPPLYWIAGIVSALTCWLLVRRP